MPTARMACVGYVLLIIYASLVPFNFNVQVGANFLNWIDAPIPKYITSFDVFTNVIGYAPLGFLLIFALYPKHKAYRALLLTMCVSAILSGLMESLQTWLPTRVPSNVDWWANMAGGTVGALLALPMDPRWLSGSAFQRKRLEWFGPRSSGILLVLVFPWAQIFPQTAWLAMGDWGDVWSQALTWKETINYAALEIVTTSLAWFGAGLTVALTMRDSAPRMKILATLLLVTVLIKGLFSGMQFGIDHALNWLTPSAFWGMILALLLQAAVLQLKRRWIYILAVISLAAMLVLVNLIPHNPYFLVTMQEWRQGRLLHFNSLMAWLSWLWPIMAGISLLRGLKPRSYI